MPDSDLGGFHSNLILPVFVLFCRIGGCLMVAPGVSNTQIPMQIRLFVAVAITLALAPLLIYTPKLLRLNEDPVVLLRLIVMESLIGVMIGTFGRLFFSALETLAVATANMLGLTNPFGITVDPQQQSPPLATAITLAATTLIFVTDLHWEIVRGIVSSYSVLPVTTDFDPAYSVRRMGFALGQAFLIAVRVASPFFLFSVLANFGLTLVNRVTPQISIFFIAPPFILAGGLTLLYFVVRAELGQFMDGFLAWISWG